MSMAAFTSDSSSCRLPMTGPHRRPTVERADSNEPRAASPGASSARE
jgi:hypothetical protein